MFEEAQGILEKAEQAKLEEFNAFNQGFAEGEEGAYVGVLAHGYADKGPRIVGAYLRGFQSGDFDRREREFQGKGTAHARPAEPGGRVPY